MQWLFGTACLLGSRAEHGWGIRGQGMAGGSVQLLRAAQLWMPLKELIKQILGCCEAPGTARPGCYLQH